jgi:hypothetical protein
VTGYWLEHRDSHLYTFQTASEAQTAPYPMSDGVHFPGREADHLPPSSAEIKIVGLYFHSPICIDGIVLN